ncbi:MAG: type II toxin-antitoxin system HicB family antitoxin [Candidatus Methylumidiphilus sp.]
MLTTHHSYRDYIFVIAYQADNPAYTVDFLDIPDIITSGDTLQQAFANACEALDIHLESLAIVGLKPPPPKHQITVKAA